MSGGEYAEQANDALQIIRWSINLYVMIQMGTSLVIYMWYLFD